MSIFAAVLFGSDMRGVQAFRDKMIDTLSRVIKVNPVSLNDPGLCFLASMMVIFIISVLSLCSSSFVPPWSRVPIHVMNFTMQHGVDCINAYAAPANKIFGKLCNITDTEGRLIVYILFLGKNSHSVLDKFHGFPT